MIRIYYMKFDSDCSFGQSLALCNGEDGRLRYMYEMLPKERKESVASAKNPEVARKRLYTGVFLQQVLSQETGVAVEHLNYRYNEQGKPELDVENIKLQFNLSHSGDYAVLAVSDQPIGVDIERTRKNGIALAKRCFCPEEYQDILSVEDESQRERRFLEYWTMKEAYIKCVGEGLRIPLNSFLIKRGENGLSVVEGANRFFATRYFTEQYYISVCSECREDVKLCLQQELVKYELPC